MGGDGGRFVDSKRVAPNVLFFTSPTTTVCPSERASELPYPTSSRTCPAQLGSAAIRDPINEAKREGACVCFYFGTEGDMKVYRHRRLNTKAVFRCPKRHTAGSSFFVFFLCLFQPGVRAWIVRGRADYTYCCGIMVFILPMVAVMRLVYMLW